MYWLLTVTGIVTGVYFFYNKSLTSNPFVSSKYIDVTKLEIFDSNNKLVSISKSKDCKDIEHFSNWLNYIYNIRNEKPKPQRGIVDKSNKAMVHYTHDNIDYVILLHKDFDSSFICDSVKTSKYMKRNILMATISNKDDGCKDITNDLKKFIGPNCDFYKGLYKDLHKEWYNTDLNHILHNIDLNKWDQIEIMDSFGQYITIDLNTTKIIDW